MNAYYNDGRVKIRDAQYSDVQAMRDHLRESDRREVAASHGHTGKQALTFSYAKSSICLTVLYNGKPVAMFGIVPDEKLDFVGSVWLLATEDVNKMWLSFVRLSRRSIEELLKARPVLYNYVDNRNTTSICWLEWAGAKIYPPKPYGMLGMSFRFFTFGEVVPAGVGGNGHL